MTKGSASKANNTVNELQHWCAQQLQKLGLQACKGLTSLSGDASFRRYYRVHCGIDSYMAVIAPPSTEKNTEFVAIAKLLSEAGLRVPGVLAVDLDRGFLLQSDLGDSLLLNSLDDSTVDALYGRALQALLRIQKLGNTGLQAYSAAQMREDLERFPEWFCEGLLNLPMSTETSGQFENFCQQLINSAMDQPQVFTHYDFQSRNLMLCDDGEIGIIDFQDALLAPVTYDPVSLLRDCYIQWPPQKVTQWAGAYAAEARAAGILDNTVSDDTFLNWFDLMSLQRHVRVLGTFARLFIRDNKPGYLGDIPLVCDYVLQVSRQLAGTADFHHWFREAIMPAVQQQDWFEEKRQ